MADGRLLRKKVSRDERLAQLSDRSALLYLLTIPHLDVEGRIDGRPAWVAENICPAWDWPLTDVERLISEWTATVRPGGRFDPLVLWYVVETGCACQFRGFIKNQPLRRDREAPSRLPSPPKRLLEEIEAAAKPRIATPVNSGQLPAVPGVGTAILAGARENGRTLDTSSVLQPHEVQTPASPNGHVQEIYDYWRTERGKTNRRYDRISDARRKKIVARLREFTADDLKQAIAAVALDPWAERPRHDDLTIILRSREQVERFLEFAEQSKSVTPEKERRYTRA
jgi:hypothetical protein